MKYFYHSLHQKLWNYLSEYPNVSKEQAIIEMFRYGHITREEMVIMAKADNYCLACAYDWAVSKESESACSHCPLDCSKVNVAKDEDEKATCLEGLYQKYMDTKGRYKMLLTLDNGNYYPSDLKIAFQKKDSGTYLTWGKDIEFWPVSNHGAIRHMAKLERQVSALAKQIANLPVKPGIPCK